MSEDLQLDAAEFVLGTLSNSERTAFASRLRTESQARHAVFRWEARFADLADTVPALIPGPHVWTGIEMRLPASGVKGSGADVASAPIAGAKISGANIHGFKVIDGGARPGPRNDASPFKQSRDRWRAAAIASGAVAAALMVFAVGREVRAVPDTPSSVYVAAVNRGGDKPALIVRVDLKTRQVFVRPVATETPAGRSLELWYIGDGKPPRSLGVIDKASATLPIPRGAQDDAATFAVTVEPKGGSTTGGPTGPIVYSGQLVKE